MGLVINLPPYKSDDILYVEVRWYSKAISPELRGWNLLYAQEWGKTHLCGWWRRVRGDEVVTNPFLLIDDPDAEYDVRIISSVEYDAINATDQVC